MIKIVGTVSCQSAFSEPDPWIPLKVTWGDLAPAPRLYLFVSDPRQGYVELKIDPDSGALRGFVVINLPAMVDRELEPAIVRDRQIALLDLGNWPWKVTPDYSEPERLDIDIESSLACSSSHNRLVIWFSDEPIAKFLQVESIRIGVSSGGELVAIDSLLENVAENWLHG
ncbi:hypothetical protein [Cellulomonas sp. URHB0016]